MTEHPCPIHGKDCPGDDGGFFIDGNHPDDMFGVHLMEKPMTENPLPEIEVGDWVLIRGAEHPVEIDETVTPMQLKAVATLAVEIRKPAGTRWLRAPVPQP